MLSYNDFVDSMKIKSFASERIIFPSMTVFLDESKIIALTLSPLRLNSLSKILLDFVLANLIAEIFSPFILTVLFANVLFSPLLMINIVGVCELKLLLNIVLFDELLSSIVEFTKFIL